MTKIDAINLQNKVSFKQNQTNENISSVQDNKESNDNTMKKSTKIMLGATAVAATIIGGLLSKKYTNPSSANFKFFKKIGGHFDNGKAFIKGKAYTGRLWSMSKNGEMRIIEYKNGIIQNSQKRNKGLLSSQKDYSYYSNGKLKEVKSYSRNSQGSISLNKQSTFTINGGIKTTNAKGEVISEVKVKADEPLAYDADKCISKKAGYTTDYFYIKDGKKIIEENIRIGDDYKSIWTEDLLTGKTTNKRVYNNGSCDILKEGYWGGNNSEVEHVNRYGQTTGYTRIEKESISYERSFIESMDCPRESYYDGDRVRRWEEKTFDANHKLIHTEKCEHITPKEQPKSWEYFG